MVGHYIVSARSRASAILYPGEQLSVGCSYPDSTDPIKLTIQTRYLTEGYGGPVPVGLWADIRGNAPDLATAVHGFLNAAAEISSIIAVGVNAAMGTLEPEVGFDASPGANEHEFLHWSMPDYTLEPAPSRPIDADSMRILIGRIADNAHRDRIMRAIAQYNLALRSWTVGNELPCLGHLYMGAEAISKAVLRDHAKKVGRTESELAADWGVEARHLESECRRRLVFNGDLETFIIARDVSDKFEHGYGDFSTMHAPASEVILTTAAHLRRSIIALLDLGEDIRARLFSGDYIVPRGPLTVRCLFRGVLVGQAEHLAAPGQVYPKLISQPKLKAASYDANGKLSYELEDRVEARIGDGVQLRLERFEVWDGSVMVPRPAPRIAEATTAQHQTDEASRSAKTGPAA